MVTKSPTAPSVRLYIAERMEKLGLSDKDVADGMGVDRVTVTRYRNDPNRLTPEKMAQLASVLDCEPDDLWHHPDRPNLNSIVRGASEELQITAADIVRRLVSR